MRRIVQNVLTLCLTAILVIGMAAPAFALDKRLQYQSEQSNFRSDFTVKNATKQLDKGITVDGIAMEAGRCFEGTLDTVVDMSGMQYYEFDLLEKQSDGSYMTAKHGYELGDHYDYSHIAETGDLQILENYLNSEDFKKKYEESEYYQEAFPAFELFQNTIRDIGVSAKLWDYEIMLDFKGYDTGSYLKFTKPGVYLVYPSTLFTYKETAKQTYGTVLMIGGSTQITAKPTASKVLVNGKETTFDAYSIDGSNYFKLRDVAKALSGSPKQFEVTWDGANKAINMVSGKAYTAVGGELAKGDGKSKPASVGAATLFVDGAAVQMAVYKIGNNNYFKLRDLGQAFDFDVTWLAAKNAIVIDTAASYTAD